MSDPVAEAAEQLAALSVANMAEAGATTPFMEKFAAQQEAGTETGNAPAVAEASVTAPATADEAGAVAELPNVASGAAEPTTEPDSAPSADGANTTSHTDASSAEPLHVRVAAHLEAIFQMAREAPAAAIADTSEMKLLIGTVLDRITNGMAVSEGELVRKLEALYHML